MRVITHQPSRVTYSAGIYSTLNNQMAMYRKERDAEEVDERRLRYKMLKKRLEDQGMDTSAQRVASMLERVSKVIEGPEEFGKEGPPEHKINVTVSKSAVALILKAIKNNDLAAFWKRISQAPGSEHTKAVQVAMKSSDVKEKINKTMTEYKDGHIDAKEAAEETIETLRNKMPPAAPDTVIDEVFFDLDSSADTIETGTTIEDEAGKRFGVKELPASFGRIMEGKYTEPKVVYREGSRGPAQYFTNYDLYVIPTDKGNKLQVKSSTGKNFRDMNKAQYRALMSEVHAPIFK